MSLNLLKYIGLGILGLGGASSVAALSSSRVRKFIGISSVVSQSTSTSDTDSSSFSEEDRKGQFLYELSKKVFNFLKNKDKLDAKAKNDVIKGLKDKFNGSLENEDDKWENFKSLCEAQKQKETGSESDMNNEYARLCFGDDGEKHHSKGWLFGGGNSGKLNYSVFLSGNLNNFELGNSFKNKYSSSSPLDKFDDGLNTNPEEIKDFFDGTKQLDSNMSYD